MTKILSFPQTIQSFPQTINMALYPSRAITSSIRYCFQFQYLFDPAYQVKIKYFFGKKLHTLRAGFEPARGDPIGFQVQRLNHSAIAAHEIHCR